MQSRIPAAPLTVCSACLVSPLVDDIPVGVELEPGEPAIQVGQLHHLVLGVVPVIRLGPVGILDGDGVAHVVAIGVW